jgi:hypothetical protein|tara:strand:+ start:276 stop:584 length:309 start_codon:yes stop_codon:yes gene_type:complete
MAEIAVAAMLSAASIYSGNRQGRRQQKAAQKAFEQQEQAQKQARSAASSERLAQAAESKQMRKRKPNTSAIMARARQRRMAGETFLTGQQGMGMLDRTRYLG